MPSRQFPAGKYPARPGVKLNLPAILENLRYREERGQLVAQLPLMRILHDEAPTPRDKQTVAVILELALEVAGIGVIPLNPDSITEQQVRVYAVCHGGVVGRFAAEQPQDFYLDDRAGFTRIQ